MDETTRTPPPPPPPTGPPAGPDRVLRRRDGHLGGVAAGIGQYLGIEANLVRVGFVLASLVGGTGVFLYLAGWLLIPTAAEDPSSRPVALRTDSATAVVGAAVLVLAALVFLGPIDRDGGLLLPLALVAAGVWLLNQRSEPAPSGPAPAGPAPAEAWARTSTDLERYAAPAPPTPAFPTPAPPTPAVPAPGHFHWEPAREVGEEDLDRDQVGAADVTPPPPPGGTAPGWAVPHGPGEPGRTAPSGPPVTSITLAVLALVLGVLLVLDSVDVVEASAVVLAATSLVVISCGLVAGAFLGRAKALIPLAFLAVLGLAAAPVADLAIDGGVADRVIRVADEATIEDEYRLGVGNLVVDLRGVEPAELDRAIEVAVGIGYAEVIVPDDVRVEVDASAAAGLVQVFGRERDGTTVSLSAIEGPTTGDEVLVLDVDVRLGALEVRHG